ncbi:cupin domain-containing protein [Paenibacillus ihbetae]|nr:cupin domain-containing protein [Paenibacillus ihbetae]
MTIHHSPENDMAPTRHVYHPRRIAESPSGRGRADVSSAQLPLLQGMAMSEIHLDRGGSLPPHWHPDTDELCYVIQGEISYHLNDPDRLQVRSNMLTSGQVAHAPVGWLHWITAFVPGTVLLLVYRTGNPHQLEASRMWSCSPHAGLSPEKHPAKEQPMPSPIPVPIMDPPEAREQQALPAAPPVLFIPKTNKKNRK